MDKTTLYKIFNKSYDHEKWLEVLQSVFGSKLLFSQPKQILLLDNDRTNSAFELGSFTTSDDRIIGLYRIDVKPEVWLERNKVGLRGLLRNVYKYDVDGAIVVFIQEGKWRLSFISEIKALNDEGEVVKQATEPKRYTYLLGEGCKVRTPADRLSKLSGKTLSLQDILNAFSVEALNEEFYKIVQEFFYQLLGGKIGKGKKKTDYGEGILQLPSTPKENRQMYQEFAVRLIGRTVFCWFLKMKKSDAGKPLLPENLLSSQAVKENSNYYHSILERLFFQTLNTPMGKRVENLPDGAEIIPFLNGGLFEPRIDDFHIPSRLTGLNENLNTLKIDNQWFIGFFEELEKYNFTIDENSIIEVEVSVDPEMLGRIFENLLAEIDPESGETARKATGSFYTPREIVDYMATESLVQYLHNKTTIHHDKLRPIFKMLEQEYPEFTQSEKEGLLDALDKVKILDPACGSGAFPIGVLQKIVQALQILDKDAAWWKKRQVNRINNAIVKKQLKEKLESSGVEYARKIGVIQNSLYGVDIQPIAAEISKLRCFLSLIVDETIDESKPNRGVEPLPNLEFKFVTADTLIKLPESDKQRSFIDNSKELQELEQLRDEYIQSFGNVKTRLKERFLKVQRKVAKDQFNLFADIKSKAYKIGNWNPFGYEKSDWFDPKWMFGVEEFDVVIGNPPYVSAPSMVATNPNGRQSIIDTNNYRTLYQKWDLYIPFMEKGLQLLSGKGLFTMIVPYPLTNQTYGKKLRELIIEQYNLIEIVDLNGTKVFINATVSNCIPFISKSKSEDRCSISHINKRKIIGHAFSQSFSDLVQDAKTSVWNLTQENRASNRHAEMNVLGDFCYMSVGMVLNADEKTAKGEFSKDDLVSDTYDAIHCRKYIEAKDIERYKVKKIRFLEYNTERSPDKLRRPTFRELYEQPKLMFNRLGSLQVYFDDNTKFLHSDSMYSAVLWKDLKEVENKSISASVKRYSKNSRKGMEELSEQVDLRYLLGVLNSKYASVLLSNLRGGDYHIYPEHLRNLPIKLIGKTEQKAFVILVTYIISIVKLDKQINQNVPNGHIVQLFEEVIDAMVMELYFKEDFEKAGVEFIKYVERYFESIEDKGEQEQVGIIHKVYQKLRERDNEIRNNLKLMDTRLTDIVMPIKTAK